MLSPNYMNDATRKLLNLPLTIDPYLMPILERKRQLESDNGGQASADEGEEQTNLGERPDISDIIRDETQHGRTVVRFLLSAMQGDIDDFKPCHRLDAARQLIKFGYDPASSFLDTYMSIQGPAPGNAQQGTRLSEPQQELHSDLARIVAEETQDGRAAVRFLVEVMLGDRSEFKPHHRINSAKELLRLGFPTQVESTPEPEPEPDPGTYVTLSDGTKVAYDGHNIACDCRSGLTDCYGSPSKVLSEPRGVKGRAERAAFDEAFPDYKPPTDEEVHRIVKESIDNIHSNPTMFSEIPLPFIRDEAGKLFERDHRERAEERSARHHRLLFPDNRRPHPE